MFNLKLYTMKKLSLIFALVAAGFMAQDAVASYNNVSEDATIVTPLQDDFSAVETSELPAAVTEAFTRDFPNAEITAAAVNAEGQYKLDITQEDGSTGQLYADAEGNWIEM
jgi:hypothetical protein